MKYSRGDGNQSFFFVILPIFLCFLLQPLSACSLFFQRSYWNSHDGEQYHFSSLSRMFLPPTTFLSGNAMIKFDTGRSFSSFFKFTNSTLGHSDEMLAVGIEENEQEKDREEKEKLENAEKERLAKEEAQTTSEEEEEVDSSRQREEEKNQANNNNHNELQDSPKEEESNKIEEREEEEEIEVLEEFLPNPEEDESSQIVKIDEVDLVLAKAKALSKLSPEELLKDGWNLVHQCQAFALYKQRRNREGSTGQDGPVEYLMIGSYDDVSPQAFLKAQINYRYRKLWDTSTKEMSESSISLCPIPKNDILSCHDAQIPSETNTKKNSDENTIIITNITQTINHNPYAGNVSESKDILYYRTKWPWPLKDRDYLLARRCKLYDQDNALVFISKSVEDENKPPIDGVVRVDNYWSYSTFLSKNPIFSTEQEPLKPPISSIDSSDSSSMNPLLERMPLNPNDSSIDPLLVDPIKQEQAIQLSTKIATLEQVQSRVRTQLKRNSKPLYHQQKIYSTLQQRQLFYKLKSLQSSLSHVIRQLSSIITHSSTNSDTVNLPEELTETSPNDNDNNNNNNSNTEEEETPVKIRIKKKIINYRPRPIVNTMYQPGVQFISLFCDDNKAPLPKSIVDLISSFAEKSVPESIVKLYEVAKQLDQNQFD